MLYSIRSMIRELIPPISFKVVALCLLWYSVSSVSSQITKNILTQFPYPLALGEFQFAIVFVLCFVTLITISKVPKIHAWFPTGSIPPLSSPAIHLPDRHILITVLPLGCFQFLGKLFSHSATALVPVSTVAGVKTLSPLVLVSTYRFLYNVKFRISTYLSLVPLVLGILVIVVSDTKDQQVDGSSSTQYVGISYAGLSLLVFVAQNIYGKTVFTYNQTHVNNHSELALSHSSSSSEMILPLFDDKSEKGKELEQAQRLHNYELEKEKSQLTSFPKIRNKYDKLTLLLYCSALGGLLALPWFLYIEAPHFFKVKPANTLDVTEVESVVIPWNLLFINGTSHFFQSLIAFHLLGAIPTVSYSIASMMKKITIIVVSMIYTGHNINSAQLFGLVLTTTGLYSYDRWGGKAA